jgi:rhodanese-related sulfurtransferase
MMYSGAASDDRVITPLQTQQLLEGDTNHLVLDVRTEQEFRSETGHIKGALLIPVQELQARLAELEPYRQKLIIAVCRSGNRSGHATTMLLNGGFQARNMVGGMLRWNAEGRPVQQETTR